MMMEIELARHVSARSQQGLHIIEALVHYIKHMSILTAHNVGRYYRKSADVRVLGPDVSVGLFYLIHKMFDLVGAFKMTLIVA